MRMHQRRSTKNISDEEKSRKFDTIVAKVQEVVEEIEKIWAEKGLSHRLEMISHRNQEANVMEA
jgi:hypothetical protein